MPRRSGPGGHEAAAGTTRPSWSLGLSVGCAGAGTGTSWAMAAPHTHTQRSELVPSWVRRRPLGCGHRVWALALPLGPFPAPQQRSAAQIRWGRPRAAPWPGHHSCSPGRSQVGAQNPGRGALWTLATFIEHEAGGPQTSPGDPQTRAGGAVRLSPASRGSLRKTKRRGREVRVVDPAPVCKVLWGTLGKGLTLSGPASPLPGGWCGPSAKRAGQTPALLLGCLATREPHKWLRKSVSEDQS